jgi:hypothetical protein
MGFGIHHHVPKADLPGISRGGVEPPAEGVDSSDEFIKGKRFCQVIIGTTLQPGNTVFYLTSSGEHEQTSGQTGSAYFAADRRTITAREHPIYDGYIMHPAQRQLQASITIVGHIYAKVFLLQYASYQSSQPFIIFDQENPH